MKSIHRALIVLFLISTVTTSFAHYCANYCLDDLCKRSNTIITGEIVSVKCFEDKIYGDAIYSSIIIRITETLKGEVVPSKTIEIISIGGHIGEKSYMLVGAPQYRENEKVLLFMNECISETFGRNFIITGMSEGKFTIENENIYRDCSIPIVCKKKQRNISRNKKESDVKNRIDQFN